MTIKHSEKCTLGPVIAFLIRWFHNIQDNWNSIFIVISNNSLICICCISSDQSVFPYWAFGWLKIWQLNSVRILLRLIAKYKRVDIKNIDCHRTWIRTCLNLRYLIGRSSILTWCRIKLIIKMVTILRTMICWSPIRKTFYLIIW